MLMPNGIHPEKTFYYNGALIMQELQSQSQIELFDLYGMVKQKNSRITFAIYVGSLDWLYLMQLAEVNEAGFVEVRL